MSRLDGDAEAGEPFGQQAFRFRLRQDKDVVKPARDGVEAQVNDPFALAEDVDAVNDTAGGNRRVGDADPLQVFQRARLDA